MADTDLMPEPYAGAHTTDLGEAISSFRRELHLHSYRMTGSFDLAEDITSGVIEKALTHANQLEDNSRLKAWLYRIATNHCLDRLRALKRERRLSDDAEDVPWLQPYPDTVLTETPETALIRRETIELAFLKVIQRLPAQQRAVFLLREIHSWPARDVAEALGLSDAAVNSALQRARKGLSKHDQDNARKAAARDEQALLRKYIQAHETQDPAAMVALMREDIRFSMPPSPRQYVGEQALDLIRFSFASRRFGEWKLIPTRANRQPAAASYLREPDAIGFKAYKIDVLKIEGKQIVDIVTFEAS